MAKCKACPHKKTCRDECYGENPCHFAWAYDRLTRKVEARDDVIQRQRVELGGLRKCSLAEHSRMFGDYVLTPVQDAFTGKIGWWISKKGFTTARYCFTASDEKEVEYQIKNGLSGHMSLLDDTMDGADAVDRIDRFLKDLLWALPKEPRGGPDEDPGFWTDGDEILCPSEMESEVLATFLEDALRELSSIAISTGYYDPEEDARNGGVDERTGFYYVKFE